MKSRSKTCVRAGLRTGNLKSLPRYCPLGRLWKRQADLFQGLAQRKGVQ